MDEALKFLDVPKNTLQQIQQERIIDWHENGLHLNRLFLEYDENYRKKICVNCTKTQRKIRNCYACDGIDSNGNSNTSCKHMTNAKCKKFKKQINDHINFHPVFFQTD